jgi:PilZ domain
MAELISPVSRSPTQPRAHLGKVTKLQGSPIQHVVDIQGPSFVANVRGTWEKSQQTMQTMERRTTSRLALRWNLRLSSGTIGTIETETENISSRGFYCILTKPLVPGDSLDCQLSIPNYGPGWVTRSILCKAEVVRVETRGSEPGFGVGCRILDFTLSTKMKGGPFGD